MIYNDILTQICAQLGDPNMDTYGNRAKYHFERAIASLISEGNYSLDDLRGYHKVTTITFSSNPKEITSLKVLKIIDLFPNPASLLANRYVVEIKQLQAMRLVSADEEYYPTKEEVYVYKIGNYLYAVYNTTASNFTTSDNLYLYYIEDPDLTGWLSDTVADSYFCISFIYKAIDIAVKNLKLEESIAE